METTMKTEKNYTINYEEAWTPNYSVSVDFTFNEVEYHAMGNYYPDNGTEDYELLNLKTNEYVDEDDEAYKLGFELICKVDIRKHLTFF